MLKALQKLIVGDYNQKQVQACEKRLPEIEAAEIEFAKQSDAEIKDYFIQAKQAFSKNPEKIDEQLTTIFAAIREACRRLQGHTYDVRGKSETWAMVPYDVQLIGGIILHQGNISEMKTGEGKTLVCTLPAIANALAGKGVHVVTVNDYLAARDAEWMKPLYEYCGLSVGTILGGATHDDRKVAYNCDITYGTNNEFGFDYLRDNMSQNSEQLVQRDLYFAIVDEVDSILIDEARTPLIISQPKQESVDKYHQYADIMRQLKADEHYTIDLKQKAAHLTEDGVHHLEKLLGLENLFADGGFQQVHHVEQALKANVIMQADIDYVVRDGRIVIVDEFTGRLMDGRRFSDGLHQALEAKEGVQIQNESKTLATITFQNYFRLYDKLAGMTGTAETEAEEFAKIYRLDTIVIPTNRPIQRVDLTDKIFQNERGKFHALADEVKKLHEKEQPVLIGTISIEKSEALSHLLRERNIPHEVLNAKQHEREAEIVAKAGQKGAVTIATNMAGRGTDIKLGDGVLDLGGLAILGTERHESRRIDNQLRGRAGRQGDPGFTQFYVSMSDELMRRFGGERMAAVMSRMKLPETEAIENPFISRSVENAQKKIEGFHFDARKHVVQYDDVMNVHRERIYHRRRRYLSADNTLAEVDQIIRDFAREHVENHCPTPKPSVSWDTDTMVNAINVLYQSHEDILTVGEIDELQHRDDVVLSIENYLLRAWDEKHQSLPESDVDQVTKQILLRSVDEWWLEHIDEMTHLRDRVALSGYAQKDPLMEYKGEGFRMFRGLLQNIRVTSIHNLFRVELIPQVQVGLPVDHLQTNADQISQQLENTGEYDVGQGEMGLTRQQKRAMKRKEK